MTSPESPQRLTERGAALFSAVAPMVEAALAARSALEASGRITGEVSVSTVGEVLRWTLVRRLPSFFRHYPELRLRILAHHQLSSLAAGEADLALRFVRPERGDLVLRPQNPLHISLALDAAGCVAPP